ncbi:pilus assembly protein PilO [Clostridium beijerinckii]|uniref:pilus assembly protein PilO n=1 Tax=Clostridium beijerinckii TaxID=1520 RepID=UPI00080A6245|nr:pilus assembly protein PilO [Clostridium beijerinckii]OCA96739.1 pilus assembly protein PilO [Clostridium beijerinckii]
MRISNKEKIMLYILGIIIIGFIYYQFVYSYQMNIIQDKMKSQNEIEQKYTEAENTIKAIESKKSDLKILKAKISDESLSFYPTISEEHIILELDTLLKDSGLNGGIKFNPVISDGVEKAKDKDSKTLQKSSIQGIVDQYNNVADDKKESNSKSEKSNSNNNVSSSNSNNDSSGDSKDKKKNTVQYVKFEVNFEGSYDGLSKLLNTIGKNEKKMVVNSIKIDEDTLNSVKGTINIEIYSIPKIDDELESYLDWKLNNTYGKSVPFSTGSANGNVQVNKDTGDFIASVKSSTSDLPTVMLGKADDSLRTTYIYGDSNSQENVEMILTQDGDKYYYKYKTSKGTFPANYDGIGEEFVPASQNIDLKIQSENRATSNDKSELKLKIINNTDKLLNVDISGDDSANPRVKIEGDGSNISVNQK